MTIGTCSRLAAVIGIVIATWTVVAVSSAQAFRRVPPSPAAAHRPADGGVAEATGPVAISTDAGGNPMFEQVPMWPGATVQGCILVTYSGTSLPADISLYGKGLGSGLDVYLDLTIEVGSGGRFADCSGFMPTATAYSGTLAAFTAQHTNFANGIRVWSPTNTPESRTYRFTVTLQDDNGAQGKTGSADFLWDAQG